jgi:hypothetical protein
MWRSSSPHPRRRTARAILRIRVDPGAVVEMNVLDRRGDALGVDEARLETNDVAVVERLLERDRLDQHVVLSRLVQDGTEDDAQPPTLLPVVQPAGAQFVVAVRRASAGVEHGALRPECLANGLPVRARDRVADRLDNAGVVDRRICEGGRGYSEQNQEKTCESATIHGTSDARYRTGPDKPVLESYRSVGFGQDHSRTRALGSAKALLNRAIREDGAGYGSGR